MKIIFPRIAVGMIVLLVWLSVFLLLLQVSYYFPHKTMWRSFFSALVAAFILQYLHPYQTDHIVMFYANYNSPWHLFELIPFLVLGVFGVSFGFKSLEFVVHCLLNGTERGIVFYVAAVNPCLFSFVLMSPLSKVQPVAVRED